MKQYTPIINLKLIAISTTGEIKREAFITQNDIGEFVLETNMFLGTSILQARFIDSSLFFSNISSAENRLYVRAESFGNEVVPMQSQYYKISSWDTYSNGMISINLAVPSMFIRLASALILS